MTVQQQFWQSQLWSLSGNYMVIRWGPHVSSAYVNCLCFNSSHLPISPASLPVELHCTARLRWKDCCILLPPPSRSESLLVARTVFRWITRHRLVKEPILPFSSPHPWQAQERKSPILGWMQKWYQFWNQPFSLTWPFSTLFELHKQEAQRAVGLRLLPVQVQSSLVALGAGRGMTPCLASTTGSGRKEEDSTGEEGTKAMCTWSRCLETLFLGKTLLLPSFSVIAMVIAHTQAVPKELHRWKPSASVASSSTGSTMRRCQRAHLCREQWLRCGPSSHHHHHPPLPTYICCLFHFIFPGFANTGCLKVILLGRPARRPVPIEAATRNQKRKWGQSPWTLELESSQCHQVLQRGGKAKKKTKVSWGGRRAIAGRQQNTAASFSWLCCAKGQR